MATVFPKQGENEKALEWFRRVLAGKEKTLGKDHPSTLGNINSIALIFQNQGKYEKALEWYRRALAGYEKTLGKDHPDTLDTINNMTTVFDSQGQYEKAMEWCQRGLNGTTETSANSNTRARILRRLKELQSKIENQPQRNNLPIRQ
jgi:tetratricopeptide (TPR) repeat protein